MAERAGDFDVDKILRQTAKWFMRWKIYYSLEPDPEIRADYRAASIAAMIANVHRGKDDKPYTYEDVIVKFGTEAAPKKAPQTPEQQFQILKLWAIAHSKAGIDKE